MKRSEGFFGWIERMQREHPTLFIVVIVLFLYHFFGDNVRRGLLGFLGIKQENYADSVDVRKEASKSKLSDIQAKSYADKLFDAMKFSGTNEEAIYLVLKDLSKEDFAKVYTAFGTRAYAPAFGESSSSWLPWATVSDLTFWLNSELNDAEKARIRSINPNIPI